MANGLTIQQLPDSLSPSDARQIDFGFQLKKADLKIDRLGMGILSDGSPFLTQRGLAALCGVENAHIGTISSQWNDPVEKPRIRKIRDILSNCGKALTHAHVEHKAAGRVIFAYREEFCLAVLEYYAFEAGQFVQNEALKHYRLLAGAGLKKLVYDALGVNPAENFDRRWQPYLDRVSLSHCALPQGYFSIFREIADMVVTLGENGVYMDGKILPDISVGKSWASHWRAGSLHAVYGERIAYEHSYPDYFPQSISNPQHPWCYPEEALPEFRRWFRQSYISGGKFRNYMESQVKSSKIDSSIAVQAIDAYASRGTMLE